MLPQGARSIARRRSWRTVISPQRTRGEHPVPRLHGWEMPWYSAAQDSLDTLLVGRRVGMMHVVCYLRQGSKVFETRRRDAALRRWTTLPVARLDRLDCAPDFRRWTVEVTDERRRPAFTVIFPTYFVPRGRKPVLVSGARALLQRLDAINAVEDIYRVRVPAPPRSAFEVPTWRPDERGAARLNQFAPLHSTNNKAPHKGGA